MNELNIEIGREFIGRTKHGLIVRWGLQNTDNGIFMSAEFGGKRIRAEIRDRSDIDLFEHRLFCYIKN